MQRSAQSQIPPQICVPHGPMPVLPAACTPAQVPVGGRLGSAAEHVPGQVPGNRVSGALWARSQDTQISAACSWPGPRKQGEWGALGQLPGHTQRSAHASGQLPGHTQRSAHASGQIPGHTQISAACSWPDPRLTHGRWAALRACSPCTGVPASVVRRCLRNVPVRSVGPALHMLRAWAGPWLALCGGRAAHTGCATVQSTRAGTLQASPAWNPSLTHKGQPAGGLQRL